MGSSGAGHYNKPNSSIRESTDCCVENVVSIKSLKCFTLIQHFLGREWKRKRKEEKQKVPDRDTRRRVGERIRWSKKGKQEERREKITEKKIIRNFRDFRKRMEGRRSERNKQQTVCNRFLYCVLLPAVIPRRLVLLFCKYCVNLKIVCKY